VAAVGAGYYAYHQHQQQKDDKKQIQVLTAQSWLAEAEARTEYYHRNDVQKPPVYWVLVHGHDIPRNAIIAGDEGGNSLYFCRAYCDGGIQVGKAGLHLSRGATYGYAHKVYDVDVYEVLVGDSSAVKWVPTGGKLRVDRLGATPVEGGLENNKTLIYLARAEHHGNQPGKTSSALDCAYIAYGSGEVKMKEYSVLCLNQHL